MSVPVSKELTVEVVNINDRYVVFNAGEVAAIEEYLDCEGNFLEGAEVSSASFCWCNHPEFGMIEVAILGSDETMKLQ